MMTEIDQLYQNATEALEAIAKYRANERAVNAKLAKIGATTLRPAQTTDATDWAFYKALSDVIPDNDSIYETFQLLCEEAGVDEDGAPLVESETRGLSDEEFDYRHAIGWVS